MSREHSQREPGMMLGMLPLVAIAAPFGLWLLEQVLPYPEIWEEGFKAGLVWLIVGRRLGVTGLWLALACGMLFAGSETILYLVNGLQAGRFGFLVWRLVLTIPMHVVTTLVLWWAMEKRMGWLGLVGALLIHFGFNEWVG